jgi:hypothetical protein
VLSVEVSTATSGRPKVLDFRFVLDPCQSFLTTEEALQEQAQINTNQLSISLNHFMSLNHLHPCSISAILWPLPVTVLAVGSNPGDVMC